MRNFFLRTLRVLGNFLWNLLQETGRGLGRLFFLTLESLGHGMARILRFLAPWVLGVGVLWYSLEYQPELFNKILTLFIMAWGFKIMVGGLLPKKQGGRK